MIICKQCGHRIAPFAGETVTNEETGEYWHLHKGGCSPDSYDHWEPTRKIER